jgi:protein-disulfide isomerase/DNA-binding protein Fis
MFYRVMAPLACLFMFTLGCQAQEVGSPVPETAAETAPAAAEDDAVVARIGGESISQSELDSFIKDRLFERQTSGGNPAKLYDLRVQNLNELILRRVIAAAAARQNTTEEAVIETEIAAMGEISDDEINQFYLENVDQMGGQTLEQMSTRIGEYLKQLRGQEVMEKLMEEAGVDVLLEPTRVEVAADGPSKGPEDAAVTIIEFSDFQCPFCSRALPVIEELMKRYPNDVRLVYRHLPLDRIHPQARPAAEASLCAGDQDQFWAYHDLLFADPKALGDEDLKRYAEELGLDVAAWDLCLSEGKFAEQVEADVTAGHAAGITGTPAFIVNGVMLSGAKPVEEFVPLIEAELERARAPGSS